MFVAVFFGLLTRLYTRLDSFSPDNSSPGQFFTQFFFQAMRKIFRGTILCRTILCWTIFRLDNSSRDNSSLGQFFVGQFFARTILRSDKCLAGKFSSRTDDFDRTIFCWTIFHPDNFSPGQFFAQQIFKRSGQFIAQKIFK
jgi:hypothetical protein